MLRRDSEPKYYRGSLMAYCGRKEEALRLLGLAVEENYCSYPALDTDPLLESLRGDPGFAEIRARAIECRQSFLDHRARH